MFCSSCGSALPEGAAFCPACGAPVVAAATAVPDVRVAAEAPPAAEPPVTPARAVPGGFWRRFWGYLLDRFLLGVAFTPVVILVLATMYAGAGGAWDESSGIPEELVPRFLGTVCTLAFIGLLASWLY